MAPWPDYGAPLYPQATACQSPCEGLDCPWKVLSREAGKAAGCRLRSQRFLPLPHCGCSESPPSGYSLALAWLALQADPFGLYASRGVRT